jgi:hypothetical protein
MGNNRAYMRVVLEEREGWRLGHNENPDVKLKETEEILLISPTGKLFCGDMETMQKLMKDPSKSGWRARNV